MSREGGRAAGGERGGNGGEGEGKRGEEFSATRKVGKIRNQKGW